MKKLSEIIDVESFQRTSKKSHWSNSSFDFLKLIRQWPEIIGPKLSEHTIPLKNHQQQLTILTSHPVYSQELSYLEETIKKKIFKVFPDLNGQVKRIKFYVNEKFFHEQKQDLLTRAHKKPASKEEKISFHPHDPKYIKLKKRALKEFESVEDEALKETLISLFIQNHFLD